MPAGGGAEAGLMSAERSSVLCFVDSLYSGCDAACPAYSEWELAKSLASSVMLGRGNLRGVPSRQSG